MNFFNGFQGYAIFVAMRKLLPSFLRLAGLAFKCDACRVNAGRVNEFYEALKQALKVMGSIKKGPVRSLV